jgi:hypothetical protein
MKRTLTGAEIWERHLTWIVLWILLHAVAYSAGALAYLSDDGAARLLTAAAGVSFSLALGVLLVGSMLALARQTRLVLSLKGPKDMNRRLRWDGSGFVPDAVRSAATAAFYIATPGLVLLEVIARDTGLPADFFIKSGLGLSLATFSMAFFVLTLRAARDEEPESPA